MLQKRCIFPNDIFLIILSFLGKETYINKFTNKIHVRFIKNNQFDKINLLFMNIKYEDTSMFTFKDSLEIVIETPSVILSYDTCTIFCNQFKKNDCFPQDILIGLDTKKNLIMQIIVEIYHKNNKDEDYKIIYKKYTYFPTKKKIIGIDPSITSNQIFI